MKVSLQLQAIGSLQRKSPRDCGEYIGERTRVIELGDKTVCPGFVDVHCFFSGYAMGFVGADLSGAASLDDILSVIREYATTQESASGSMDPLLGHGWNSEKITGLNTGTLDREFGKRPVVLFAEGGETCWMNTAAQLKYQFTPETCYPEAYWRLLREVLADKAFITDFFKRYMAMLNGRGITAVKEMGFDDFYGFTEILEDLEKNEELSLRVSFMSQPVGKGMDLEYGKAMRGTVQGRLS